MAITPIRPLTRGTNYTIKGLVKKNAAKKVPAKKGPIKKIPAPAKKAPAKKLVSIIPKRLAKKAGVPTKIVNKRLVGKKIAKTINVAKKRAARTPRTRKDVFRIGGRKVTVARGGRRVVVKGSNRTVVRVRRRGVKKTVVRTGTGTKRRADDTVTVKRLGRKKSSFRRTVFNKGGRRRTLRVVHKRGSPRVRVTRVRKRGKKTVAKKVVVVGPKRTRGRYDIPTRNRKKAPPKKTNRRVVKGRGKRVSMRLKHRGRGPRHNLSLTPEQIKNVAARKFM